MSHIIKFHGIDWVTVLHQFICMHGRYMISKSVTTCESFQADVTFKRSFPGVCTFMADKLRTWWFDFRTICALVNFTSATKLNVQTSCAWNKQMVE